MEKLVFLFPTKDSEGVNFVLLCRAIPGEGGWTCGISGLENSGNKMDLKKCSDSKEIYSMMKQILCNVHMCVLC